MIRLPDRPLRVHPPGAGTRSQLALLAWAVLVLAALSWMVIRPIGDLLTDRELVGKVQPVAGARVHGSCSVHLGLVTSCDGTLTVPRPGQPDLTRTVDYFFIDAHAGDYHIAVVADPARPELLSTDLGLDKLTNRMITLVVLGPLFLVIGVVGLVVARRTVGRQRATLRALSQQVLRPVLLRMDRYALGHWTVTALSSGARPVSWSVPNRARPIVMDPSRRAVLGVTAGDGQIAMPLDAQLGWIELAADERRELLDQLGPDRLGGWLAALDSGELQAERGRLRRMARGTAIAGVCLAALAGGAAWVAFRDHDPGAGERVELHRGDEAPRSGDVALRGVWQTERAAQVTRPEGRFAVLETWIPVTAPGWTDDQPVTWIVRDGSHGAGTAGLATRSGTVLNEALPADARAELARRRVLLAPTVRVLDVPLPPPDPLRMPALAVLVIGGALALGLLLGAAIVGARARRRAAILSAGPRRG
jgi:hypothetical protein